MAKFPYLKNSRTGKKFRVVNYDPTRKEVVLQGEHNAFREPYNKERFKKLGYIMVEEEATG